MLYFDEISDGQQEAWQQSIEVFEVGQARPITVALLLDDCLVADQCRAASSESQCPVVRIKLCGLELRRPRQWGACWLGCHLDDYLELDAFFARALPASRKGTRRDLIFQTLCPLPLHRPASKGVCTARGLSVARWPICWEATPRWSNPPHKLHTCHDQPLAHKTALFTHPQARWKDLFNARFDVLLDDLTNTYFEDDPPEGESDKRRFGYRRDESSDCVQVVVALVVPQEGFALAHEVIFIAFVACCLQVTVTRRLRNLAPGLTARSVPAKFAAPQMIDVHRPTTDGRKVVFARYTRAKDELKLLLAQLKSPRYTRTQSTARHAGKSDSSTSVPSSAIPPNPS